MNTKKLVFAVSCAAFVFLYSVTGWNSLAAEEMQLWVIPVVPPKRDHVLIAINPKTPNDRSRRIRCTEAMPIYIQEMSARAEKLGALLVLRISVDVRAEAGGERAVTTKVLMACLLPEASIEHLLSLAQWEKYRNVLADETAVDPMIDD